MKIIALGYIGFTSPAFQEWKSWAPKTLGLGVADNGLDDAVRLRMDERHHRLAIHPGPKDDLAYLGWELESRLSFEAALRELDEKKVPYKLGTSDELQNRRVANMAWLNDPYGYRHELYHGQEFVYGTFSPCLPFGGFRLGQNGELGVGHAVLAVPELTREGAAFATEILGFDTYFPTGVVEFYRCNSRSHCLAYLPIPGMSGPHHFYIDARSMDDVGIAFDRCREQGCVVLELGRMAQDDDISFYLRSPSGVDIQYGNGSRLFDRNEIWSNPSMMTHPRVWGHKEILRPLCPTVRPVGAENDIGS